MTNNKKRNEIRLNIPEFHFRRVFNFGAKKEERYLRALPTYYNVLQPPEVSSFIP